MGELESESRWKIKEKAKIGNSRKKKEKAELSKTNLLRKQWVQIERKE